MTERRSLKLSVRLLRAKLERALEEEDEANVRSVVKLKSRSVSEGKMQSSSIVGRSATPCKFFFFLILMKE